MNKIIKLIVGKEDLYKDKKEMSDCASTFVLCFLLLIIHLFFVFFFLNYSVNCMVILNILSFFAYIVACLVNKRTKGKASSLIITLEICLYCIISALLIGWQSDNRLFLAAAIIPCFIFYPISIKRNIVYNVMLFASLFICLFIRIYIKPIYVMDLITLQFINIFLFMGGTSLVLVCNRIGYSLTENYYSEKIELLTKEANIDPLTSLWNRRYAKKIFDTMFSSNSVDYNYAFVLLDIDFFKTINDTFGHNIGDLVLKNLSQNILSFFRENDLSVRWVARNF